MKEQLAQIGLDALKALSPVILALIGWIGLLIEKQIRAKIKNEALQNALSRLDTVIIDAVKEVQQTFVSGLKKPTAEDFKKAKSMALATIETHLGKRGQEELKLILGLEDLYPLINTKLEAHVLDIKMAKLPTLKAGRLLKVSPTPGGAK